MRSSWHVLWGCLDLQNWPLSMVLAGTQAIEQSCQTWQLKHLRTLLDKQKIILKLINQKYIIIFATISFVSTLFYYYFYFLFLHPPMPTGIGHSVNTPCFFLHQKEASFLILDANEQQQQKFSKIEDLLLKIHHGGHLISCSSLFSLNSGMDDNIWLPQVTTYNSTLVCTNSLSLFWKNWLENGWNWLNYFFKDYDKEGPQIFLIPPLKALRKVKFFTTVLSTVDLFCQATTWLIFFFNMEMGTNDISASWKVCLFLSVKKISSSLIATFY